MANHSIALELFEKSQFLCFFCVLFTVFSSLGFLWLKVAAGFVSVILSTININNSDKHRALANRLVHLSLGFVFVSTFCNVIKMNFGLDPAN